MCIYTWLTFFGINILIFLKIKAYAQIMRKKV